MVWYYQAKRCGDTLLNSESVASGRLVLKAAHSLVALGLGVVACSVVLPLKAAEPDGRAAFERVCARCHGAVAEGEEGPALVPMYLTRDNVVAIVRAGQAKMPALPRTLVSDEEVTAIVEYLNSLGH
jgi:mono/diheme cytochrome c family protein